MSGDTIAGELMGPPNPASGRWTELHRQIGLSGRPGPRRDRLVPLVSGTGPRPETADLIGVTRADDDWAMARWTAAQALQRRDHGQLPPSD